MKFSVQQVNGYCGEAKFIDVNGCFHLVGNSYIFEFRDQVRCSATDETLHDILFNDIECSYDTNIVEVKSMFSDDKSPGRAFFEVDKNVSVREESNGIRLFEQYKSMDEYKNLKTFATSEVSLTFSVYQVLIANGIQTLLLDQIQSKQCPFSGGGDIAFLRSHNSAVVATKFSDDDEPGSPRAEGELKASFDIEFKYADRNCDHLVKQLLSNMMVVAAMTLNKVCMESKQPEIKSISTYGLAVDSLLPMQLFKLTINFDKKCVTVVQNCKIKSCIPFIIFDKALTYMIRNTV